MNLTCCIFATIGSICSYHYSLQTFLSVLKSRYISIEQRVNFPIMKSTLKFFSNLNYFTLFLVILLFIIIITSFLSIRTITVNDIVQELERYSRVRKYSYSTINITFLFITSKISIREVQNFAHY